LSYQTLLYQVQNGVATVTLNRPEALNALNQALKRDLAKVICRIADDPEVRCMVLTGAGRAFSAGGDIKEMDPLRTPIGSRDRLRHTLLEVLRPLVRLEKPVIAAVNGLAVGAGFNLALAADIIIAAEDAMFSQIFVQVGLVPDTGGLYFLTRLVGLNKVKELCFTGRRLSGREAAEMGIANRAVPGGELMAASQEVAAEIAAGPSTAIGLMKTLLNQSSTSTFDEMLELESYAQALAASTSDHREGILAFKEKRRPQFAAAHHS
jgi:2-(1,2-epoxy-1,2-dihydrophenyl)acetyl-CoA isomerase